MKVCYLLGNVKCLTLNSKFLVEVIMKYGDNGEIKLKWYPQLPNISQKRTVSEIYAQFRILEHVKSKKKHHFQSGYYTNCQSGYYIQLF